MLILVGSDDKSPESLLAKRFGHAKYFIMYNTESKNFHAIQNIDEFYTHDNLKEFLDKGVEVFIIGNIGPFAFKQINTPFAKVYLARKMSVREA